MSRIGQMIFGPWDDEQQNHTLQTENHMMDNHHMMMENHHVMDPLEESHLHLAETVSSASSEAEIQGSSSRRSREADPQNQQHEDEINLALGKK